jgi:hypothetical protein
MAAGTKRWPLVAALLIGLGLAAAPVAFQMFERAPLGGDMIDDFEPYMVQEKIDTFRGYMDLIGTAVTESADLRTAVIEGGSLTADQYDGQFIFAKKLSDDWTTINTDMTDLLDRMDSNMDNYAAVAALPSFDLFPWFFVLPGLMVAGTAGVLLWKSRRGPPPRKGLWVLAGLGIALMAAPLVFQMFTRAPAGGRMIDDFRPMMTRERVQNVQGYFVTLGGGEGQLRVGAIPALEATGGSAGDFPGIAAFSAEWPTIVGEFNPMIATMSDNIDNFEAVDAMPPFPMFPWFFVIPGALVVVLAVIAMRRSPSPQLAARSDK